VFRPEHDTENQHVEHAAVLGDFNIDDRRVGSGHTGVVANQIKAAEPIDGARDGGDDVALVGHVGMSEGDALAELGLESGAEVVLEVSYDSRSALGHDETQNGLADPAGTTGHDCDLPGEATLSQDASSSKHLMF
jgi:hypothetical protein